MLTVIRGKRKLRRFLVYDFEWVPGSLEMRLCGLYDGQQYQSTTSINDFLNLALTSANRGAWFYAHAGGLADIQFIFEALAHDTRYRVRASFSGSSAIIVRISQGKNNWTFIDSYWLLRSPLKAIGEWVGIEKPYADETREWYASVDLATLRHRNKLDCIILYQALLAFEVAILDEGGQLQATLASTAMHLFRRRYLRQDIPTSDGVNHVARQSYFASRVEVFRRECFDANYYDINSSFPFAMTVAAPGELKRTWARIPDRLLAESEPCALILADLALPDTYIPPLPTRIGSRVFFPTGQFSGWFTGVDFNLAIAEGARILKVYEVYEFEPFTDLADYARNLYERRRRSNNEFEKIVLKLLLNSLYGKFAESPHKQVLYINPKREVLERLAFEKLLLPGIWLDNVSQPLAHVHVPIASHITAIARRTLYRFLTVGQSIDYCDTDGYSTSSFYRTGDELGALKLEKLVRHGTFISPKIYKLDALVKGEQETIVKAKGFSLGHDKPSAIKKWDTIAAHGVLEIERMTRIRENFRRGQTSPSEGMVKKMLSEKVVPKRFGYPDGDTRPWHISEIEHLT